MKKVIVAMSGGVDSSVSAYLLKKMGYHTVGLFMKNWEEDDNEEYCSSASDFLDAKLVCNQLKIDLFTVNFSSEYWNNVFKYFISEYKLGRTPNPDILCNKEIKFKLFLNFAIKNLKADFIATGHYVRLQKKNGSFQLLRAIDKKKDQSYFLYTLNQHQLSHIIFPIGEFKKTYVRNIAKKINLCNAEKKDSFGICFIGKKKFNDFIGKYISDSKKGFITTFDGKILGKHRGIIYYTIGQRKGLKIGGIKNLKNLPWYVVDKNTKNNTIIVAQGKNNPHLMSSGFFTKKIHWIDPSYSDKIIYCTVKIRYRHVDVPCKIKKINSKNIFIKFFSKIEAVTPGQSAVFYKNETCLGGGIIEKKM